jgi:hypothetical protein
MIIGPDPIISIFWMSVRFGIGKQGFGGTGRQAGPSGEAQSLNLKPQAGTSDSSHMRG